MPLNFRSSLIIRVIGIVLKVIASFKTYNKMERLFSKPIDRLHIYLVNELIKNLSIKDLIQLMKVSKRMRDIIKATRIFENLKRINEKLKGYSFVEMISNNCSLMEETLAEELKYQRNLQNTFNLEYWKNVNEVVVHILSMKLMREQKIEIGSEIEKKTVNYLNESLDLIRDTSKRFSIKVCNLAKNSAEVVSSLISTRKLTELDLSGCTFTPVGFKSLITAFEADQMLSQNPLRKLILQRCKLGDKKVKEIVTAIQNRPNLYYLDLTHNKIKEEPFSIMMANPHNFHLSNIKLDFNEISQKGAKWFSKFVKKNGSLKRLSFVNAISDEKSFNHLSLAFSKLQNENRGVNKITLGLNTLLDPTAENFITALRLNRSIKCIKLFFFEFTDYGLRLFYYYLSDPNCQLTRLVFCSFSMKDKIKLFEKLIDCLIENSSITSLTFSQCLMDHQHFNLILKLFNKSNRISYLDVSDNIISEYDAKILRIKIESFRAGNKLDLFI